MLLLPLHLTAHPHLHSTNTTLDSFLTSNLWLWRLWPAFRLHPDTPEAYLDLWTRQQRAGQRLDGWGWLDGSNTTIPSGGGHKGAFPMCEAAQDAKSTLHGGPITDTGRHGAELWRKVRRRDGLVTEEVSREAAQETKLSVFLLASVWLRGGSTETRGGLWGTNTCSQWGVSSLEVTESFSSRTFSCLAHTLWQLDRTNPTQTFHHDVPHSLSLKKKRLFLTPSPGSPWDSGSPVIKIQTHP